jgi:SAM-dependent methyltransferase
MTVPLRRDPGLWLLLHLRPLHDRSGDEHGRCTVCGAETRFVRNSWILSRELRQAWPPGFVARESMLCAECGSSLRVRLLAEALLALYGAGARSVAELVQEPGFRGLRVAEINAAGRMHPFLAVHPALTYVEYPQEDIQSLSWPDDSYDLVLTSETLEHVPDLRRALAETRRVLRPGGRHLLTVPVDPRRDVTASRDWLPEQHHGRGGGPFALVTRRADMLAHWDIGRDMPELLREAGFEPEPTGAEEEEGVYAATAR